MENGIGKRHANGAEPAIDAFTLAQETLKLSAAPSSGSTAFANPTDARGLAIQATDVATRLLNGQMNVDIAKTYSSIIRTAAQAISAEVQRARAAREVPDLSLRERGKL